MALAGGASPDPMARDLCAARSVSEYLMILTSATTQPFGTYPPNRLQSALRDVGQRLPNNWPGLRFSGWLRSLLKRTSRRPIDVTVLGQRMRLRLADNACERRLMVTPQFFDPIELDVLRSVVRDNFHFVDLGANVGTYSIFVGTLAGPDARILAVEPQQSLLPRLRENIALNNLDIRVAPVAVGDRDGEIEFAVDTNNLGFTSVNTQRKGRGERRVIKLPVRKLLDLVREHGFERIDALKADIEGAEDLALLPFLEEAPRALWPRLVIMEMSPREWRRDCIAVMRELGYRRLHVPSSNVVLRLPSDAPAASVKPRVSRQDADRLVEGDLLGAHAAGEGHRLDADGVRLGERL
jgi:FkbM family methyltransferase